MSSKVHISHNNNAMKKGRNPKLRPRDKKGSYRLFFVSNSIGACLVLHSLFSFRHFHVTDLDGSDNAAIRLLLKDFKNKNHRQSSFKSNERENNKKDQADWILNHWEQHVQELQHELSSPGTSFATRAPKRITAYLEPLLNFTKPSNENRTDTTSGNGIPPEYYKPLPLRTQAPKDLIQIVYGKVPSCQDIPALLTLDHDDSRHEQHVSNISFAEEFDDDDCPIDVDPFLPWIHDIFWIDGKVHFIAQNKRRCKAGDKHGDNLERLEPQVALFQPISIKRLSNNSKKEVQELAPELWQKRNNNKDSSKDNNNVRYRLAPFEEADVNATRFICKYHTWNKRQQRIDIGETLSEFPFNYELIDYRKRPGNLFQGLLTRRGQEDHGKYWTSTLLFSCPIPEGITVMPHQQQQQNTAAPVLFVDIIPIRTPPRYPILAGGSNAKEIDPGYYFHADWVGQSNVGQFDPTEAWGAHHVVPEIEASGRWENLPVCPLSLEDIDETNVVVEDADGKDTTPSSSSLVISQDEKKKKKPHLLSACLWASASFRTPTGSKPVLSDVKSRLKEWIDFHLLVGFDHIYVYDNSAANSNATDLSDVTDLYPTTQVTRIDWPSVVCHNKLPLERSSQYAAENSCRTRYAHRTEWIAVIDADEYLVPMGKHKNLRTVVENAKDTNILSFKSTRGKLRFSASEPFRSGSRRKSANVTHLEAYNCDSVKAPKPAFARRAKKQLFRADYVLNHFVHYSTVTKAHLTTYKDDPDGWSRFLPKDPTERFVDEIREGTMIHTKTAGIEDTRNYRKRCNVGYDKRWKGCFVGFPWPNNKEVQGLNQTDGTEYNCFVNEKVEDYWLPRLKETMMKKQSIVTG